jgi:two-component system sensor histidine kinase VicK
LQPPTAIETTKIYYGEEAAMKILLQAMANVKKEAVICSDANSPVFSMTMEPVKKGYIDFRERDVSIRQIVEITRDNLQYCKEFMNYVELRHMDGLKGNMAVSETEYVATSVVESSKPVTQTIYSNAKAFLEQQRYFFENLWDKAIPAEQRIKEIEEDIHPQRIETVYGREKTIQAILRLVSTTMHELCVYAESSYPQVVMSSQPIVQAYSDLKNARSGKARWITEVDLSNIQYIKKLMQFVEVRHLDGIKGNAISVNENESLTTINLKIGDHSPYAIINTVRDMVEQQKFTFETLWAKAVPAERRIREIEDDIEPQRIEVLYDTKQALELYQSLIISAEREIKLMLPTINAVIRQDKAGIMFLLQEAAKKCQIKLLMPNEELTHGFIPTNNSAIVTRFIEQQEGGKATILIVDNKASLMMELKDDSKKIFHEAIGISTYSNSKAGVLSYVSMFESLWKQSQLYEELKNSEKMQKEFINIAAHELRTPTQAILGYAELGQTEGSGVNKEEALSKILRNAERLQRLTEDILDVTRIESQTLKLNKTKVDLRDIAASVLDNFKNRIQDGKNVKFVLSDADKSALVVADKERVSQVLSNLVTNALKFTTMGTISISIDEEVNIDENKKEFIVSVKDTGTGIDSEVIPRLFTKFASKSQTGTGLGLYISKNIVEALGGRIWAENNADGKGATFRFSLPIG